MKNIDNVTIKMAMNGIQYRNGLSWMSLKFRVITMMSAMNMDIMKIKISSWDSLKQEDFLMSWPVIFLNLDFKLLLSKKPLNSFSCKAA